MALKLSNLAREDLEEIRIYTVRRWGRTQWLIYYRGLAKAFLAIEANPMIGRDRHLFRKGMRSLNCGQHIIFFAPIVVAGGAPVILRTLHQRRHLPALSYYEDLEGA